MKFQLPILILFAALFAACGGGDESVQAIVASGNIEDVRAKKKALSEQQKEIEKQIAELDAFIVANDTNKKLPLVTTFETKLEDFNHFIQLQGDVTTKQNVLIYPEMAGTLLAVYVTEGDKVSKGQLLARIDDGGMSSQLAQLKTQLSLAKTTFERQKRLWEQKIGTEIQYLQAKANYEAQQNTVNQFESQLSKFNIRAPFNGVIDNVIKDQGTVVAPGPGSEIFRIVNLSDMYVEISVPETYISSIVPGKKAKVHFPVLGKTIESKVRQTSNYINPNNRSFVIEVPVPAMNGLVKPNLTAKVEINDYNNPKAILIPQSVISENSDGEQYAYVASKLNGESIATANKVIIQTGKTQGDMVEVTTGLNSGDNIIKEGARSVKDGQEVKVIRK
ncbi:efflux RND transporter periplasmic adaptor subunit [Fulvivirga lutea]|uniref:Efflux RND transporter periplasmic adaptor subunit n=1 Tax=Fulvivirga lutea TaxID=2810512 RepID=A0A974WEM2_9BACT|nr:efflux RND transporter periplasmic adaptor subunit [Fulvivirga lutea]QSE96958.1 efflux RND transporter periplasmic adaptor subunit [Fulvivirga lutea]